MANPMVRMVKWGQARIVPNCPQPEADLALAPVFRLTTLVRNGKHRHHVAPNLVEHRVRKVAENMFPDRILVFRPHQCIDSKPIDCLKCLGSKSIGRNRAALEVPEKSLPDFRLGLWQNLDAKPSHRALSLALASAQEIGLTAPARRAACRTLISCRQASVIEESSLPSRLSSNATVKADRSSGGNPRASSRMWSTWAFMRRSLALNNYIMATADPQFDSKTPACQPGHAPKLKTGGRGAPADRYVRFPAPGGLTEYPARPAHR